MYQYNWVPLSECPLHISSKWGQVEDPSPPIDPPTTQELRERRDTRIREAIDVCVESGHDIMHLVLNSRIPAGALLDLWREECGEIDQYHGKDLTIKSICRLRRIHRNK